MPLAFQLERLLSRPDIAKDLDWSVHSPVVEGVINSRYATGRWRHLRKVSAYFRLTHRCAMKRLFACGTAEIAEQKIAAELCNVAVSQCI